MTIALLIFAILGPSFAYLVGHFFGHRRAAMNFAVLLRRAYELGYEHARHKISPALSNERERVAPWN